MDVRTMCLGILASGDASGYEIKKEFESGKARHFLDASFGSIYPALTRLTEEGLVACRTEAQNKRPDKKVYSLTDAGWTALDAALMQPVARDRYKSGFLFVMMFADRLPRSHVAKLIDKQIAEYKADLEEIEDMDGEEDSPGAAFTRRYGKAMYRASIDFLERNRHLLEAAARDDSVIPAQQAGAGM